jgi:pyrimidine-nucleoside phosphorylase
LLASQIISKKRDGGALEQPEIEFMIRGMVDGSVATYQMSAFAMAVFFQGMTPQETADLTIAMLRSGTQLPKLGSLPRVDKHSTGGLGDKVSLILAPLLACFEVHVPMLSGRGLGITGGTLDKLEAFEGFRCDLSESQISQCLLKNRCVITGTTPEIAPADRILYGLRDVTATVPSVPLITASILSKKLAESLDALVLDVKFGSGAFMKSAADAKQLANSLTSTCATLGLAATSLLSSMEQPLGEMVGNACEVNEALEVLRGQGPNDTRQLTLRLAADLLYAAALFESPAKAQVACQHALDGGQAYERFAAMVIQQGGKFTESLPLAPATIIESPASGWLHSVDGEQVGSLIIRLGGGRKVASETIDPTVGVQVHSKVGQRVEAGEPLATIFKDSLSETLASKIRNAFHVSPEPSPSIPLILPAGP